MNVFGDIIAAPTDITISIVEAMFGINFPDQRADSFDDRENLIVQMMGGYRKSVNWGDVYVRTVLTSSKGVQVRSSGFDCSFSLIN